MGEPKPKGTGEPVNISESDEFPNPLLATTLEDMPNVTADAGALDAAPKGFAGDAEVDEEGAAAPKG
jgi:hypothetical protein